MFFAECLPVLSVQILLINGFVDQVLAGVMDQQIGLAELCASVSFTSDLSLIHI